MFCRYEERNVLCLASTWVYSADVPEFLRNRPVRTCECPDWKRRCLPCKHLLTVIITRASDGWNSLPDTYRPLPQFSLDPDTAHAAVSRDADFATTYDEAEPSLRTFDNITSRASPTPTKISTCMQVCVSKSTTQQIPTVDKMQTATRQLSLLTSIHNCRLHLSQSSQLWSTQWAWNSTRLNNYLLESIDTTVMTFRLTYHNAHNYIHEQNINIMTVITNNHCGLGLAIHMNWYCTAGMFSLSDNSLHSCYCYNNVIYLLTNTSTHYWGNAAEMQQLRKHGQRFSLSFKEWTSNCNRRHVCQCACQYTVLYTD